MRHLRYVPAHGIVDDRLARGVGEMVVAANDMGDAHVVVIDHDSVHIGRCAIRTENDEIVQILVREANIALHGIVHDGFAIPRRLDSDDRLYACRCLGGSRSRQRRHNAAGGLRRVPSRAFLPALPGLHSNNRPCRLQPALRPLRGGAARARTARLPRHPNPGQARSGRPEWLPLQPPWNVRGRYLRCAAASCRRNAWRKAS